MFADLRSCKDPASSTQICLSLQQTVRTPSPSSTPNNISCKMPVFPPKGATNKSSQSRLNNYITIR